jgi:hypothetical protein
MRARNIGVALASRSGTNPAKNCLQISDKKLGAHVRGSRGRLTREQVRVEVIR